MRSDKKGQFYLLAAVVIITIIVGFAGVSNSLKKNSGIKLQDSGEELNFESGQVLEYGVTHETNLTKLVTHFTTSYDEYAGENKEILFIVGNPDLETYGTGDPISVGDLEVYSYSDTVTGTIGVTLGTGAETSLEITERLKTTISATKKSGEEVSVDFNDQIYTFEIKPGENFYFVISQTIDDEKFIVTN